MGGNGIINDILRGDFPAKLPRNPELAVKIAYCLLKSTKLFIFYHLNGLGFGAIIWRKAVG